VILSTSIPLGPLCGTLFSPSRGLFIFSPFLLFLFVRLLPFYRRKYALTPLEILLVLLSVAWWIGTARWPEWWGGGSYGPRLLCELLPCVVILLVPVAANLSLGGGWTSKACTALFAIAGAVSIGIHFRGATAQAVHDWNGGPPSISEAPQRAWSWKDPQFLRGLNVLRLSSEFRLSLGSRRRIQAGHLPAPIVFRAGEVQEHICGALLGHGRSGSDFHTISVDGAQIDEHRWVLEEVVAVV